MKKTTTVRKRKAVAAKGKAKRKATGVKAKVAAKPVPAYMEGQEVHESYEEADRFVEDTLVEEEQEERKERDDG